MNTGEVCNRNPITVRRSEELLRVAQLMREKHIGYLVVVEPSAADEAQRPVGVVTDRDIVISVVAAGADPLTLRAGDVMTEHPVTVGAAEPVENAMRQMRRIGVRRLPVLGQRGELVGVLSLDDVLEVLAGDLQNLAGSIRNERVIERSLRP
ncbi:MAG TPA: CBS domain-containing protein [Steroidobacteraceae bacterium]|nr:CBS domain-containing protein [Steroidobacteraceae bacterium]